MDIITCWIFGIWFGLYGVAMGQSNNGTEGTQGIGVADHRETTTGRNCQTLEDLSQSPEIRRNMTTRLEQCFSKYGPLYPAMFGPQPPQTAEELEKTYFEDKQCITEEDYMDGVTKYIEFHETCGKSRLKRENSVIRIKDALSNLTFTTMRFGIPTDMTAEEIQGHIFSNANGTEEYFRLISKFVETKEIGPFEDNEFNNYYSMACPTKYEYEYTMELEKSRPKSPFDTK